MNVALTVPAFPSVTEASLTESVGSGGVAKDAGEVGGQGVAGQVLDPVGRPALDAHRVGGGEGQRRRSGSMVTVCVALIVGDRRAATRALLGSRNSRWLALTVRRRHVLAEGGGRVGRRGYAGAPAAGAAA